MAKIVAICVECGQDNQHLVNLKEGATNTYFQAISCGVCGQPFFAIISPQNGLCPSCEHASHEWCNIRPEINTIQEECKKYKFIKSDELKANLKQKENVEKYGMLGMVMNPYEPFIPMIDYDYEEQRLLKELESVRKAKAEAHLTLDERYERAVKALIKASEGMFDDVGISSKRTKS